jgi:membrane protease YdiL (CAAX protease family)
MNATHVANSKSFSLAALTGKSASILPCPADDRPLVSETPAPTAGAPVARSAPGWWEAPLWMLGFFVAYQLIPGTVFVISALLSGVGPGQLADTATEYALPIMLGGQVLAVCLSLFALRVRVGRNWIGAVQLRRPPLVPCLLALLCLPALMLLGFGIVTALTHLTGQEVPTGIVIAQSMPQWGLLFCLLVVAVGAAVNEELFCRGFLGRGLVGRHGVPFGVLYASAIFGAMHLNLPQGAWALVLGCFLHLAYLATRSLWAPILLHFVNNAAALLMMSAFPDFEPTWWQVVLCAVVAIPSGYALYRLRDRQIAGAQVA